jgi:hypothetical protein
MVRKNFAAPFWGIESLTIQCLGIATPSLSKLWHAVAGLYVYGLTFSCTCHAIQLHIYRWEFVTTLDYEWKVIRGRIPYRWTIWVRSGQRFALASSHMENFLVDSAFIRQIYSLTRVAGLLGVLLSLVGADVMAPINCQVMVPYLPPYI